jgi:putative ABC transport system permease protein
MTALWFELKQTLRGFAARPLFVAVTVLTLALGIGANTAIFTAVDALLLKRLPYPDPQQLVMLWSDGTQRGFARQDVVNPGVMKEWERSMTTVQSVAAFNFWDSTLTTAQGATLIQGAEVSERYFATLGVPLLLGRGFTPEEDQENGPRVVVVSHAFWQREFAGDPGVLGRTVDLNRETWTIIGVLPEDFIAPTFPGLEVFRPLQRNSDPRGGFWLSVMARLKPGATIEQADADLDAVQARLADEYPDELHLLTGYVQPLAEMLVQDVRRQLLVLLGATLFVLLIACANVANLLLARAVGRARELAVRAVVGAGRTRIVRQLLIESTLLAVFGMLIGIGIAWFGVTWIAAALPPDLAQNVTLRIDMRVLGFTVAVSLLTGLLAGCVPALLACRGDLGVALRDGDRASAGGRDGRRARALLVAGTFALALGLTVGAGLFLKSLLRMHQVDPGFRAAGLLTFAIGLPEAEYPDPDALRRAQEALQTRLAVLPGVTGVGFTSTLPLYDLVTDTGTAIEGVALEGDPLRTWYSRVTPGYLQTLGVPLERGRDIADNDAADAPCMVVANRTYARRYLGGANPIGRHVLLNPRSDGPLSCEIVGVAGDVRFNSLAEPPDPTLYLPASRFPNRRFFVVMRAAGDPLALLPSARRAVAAIDPGLALWSPAPMTTLLHDSLRTPRLVAILVGAFAALALLLAASGVYGVATYNVSARTREFGVRMALGARRLDLLRQVIGGGLRLVAGGLAMGILVSLAIGGILETLLFEVEPFDIEVFAGVALLLIVTAMAAMLIPARRAARVHPMEALRYE